MGRQPFSTQTLTFGQYANSQLRNLITRTSTYYTNSHIRIIHYNVLRSCLILIDDLHFTAIQLYLGQGEIR